MLNYFQKLDFFVKHDDSGVQKVQTKTGAVLSIFSIITSIVLFIVELVIWFRGEVSNEMIVDTSLETTMQISFNITFPHLECRFIALDLIDQGGNRLLNVWRNVKKTDLDVDGKILTTGALKQQQNFSELFGNTSVALTLSNSNIPDITTCLPCYEATSEVDVCCNTCADLIAAFQKTEMDFIGVFRYPQCRHMNVSSLFVDKNRGGCNVQGELTANRVEGYMEIGLIRPFRVNATGPEGLEAFFESHLNLTHHIHSFSFGLEHKGRNIPLRDYWTYQPYPPIFNYLMKIVPTTFISSLGRTTNTFQYSLTRYTRRFTPTSNQSPGAYFYFEFTPQRVIVREKRHSVFHLLVRICAVVGGVAALTKGIDSVIYQFKLAQLRTQNMLDAPQPPLRKPQEPQQPLSQPTVEDKQNFQSNLLSAPHTDVFT